MFDASVPWWVGIPVLVIVLAMSGWAWVMLRRAAYASLDSSRARLVSILAALSLGSALSIAFVISAVIRPAPSAAATAALLVWIVLLVTLGYGLRFISPEYRRAIEAVPMSQLLLFQSYRIAGAAFLMLYALGRLPAAFALPAGIGDLIAAAASVIAAVLWIRAASGRFAWAWAASILGIADFIIAIAAGTELLLPALQGVFGVDAATPALLPVFPIGMIPFFVIPLGLVVHAHTITRLLEHSSATAGARAEPERSVDAP